MGALSKHTRLPANRIGRRSGAAHHPYLPTEESMLKNAAVLLLLSVLGCAGSNAATKPDSSRASLYDRLGQKPAITAVVDDFIANVAADTRINAAFAKADIPHLKAMLVEQICQAAGGPCTYSGKDMVTAHTGQNVTGDQFNEMVEDLVKTLDKFKVGEREKKELLAALGGMQGDIVGK
jgi:hemoglobin